MEILLLDAKEYTRKKGKLLCFRYCHFNMKKYTDNIFSDGWCHISELSIDKDGNIYGKIVNEDDIIGVPAGYYNNIVVNVNDDELENMCQKTIERYTTYKNAIEGRDYSKIDKLNKLTNKETFWDDVRKLTKNVKSDHSIGRWQCLAEYRWEELNK